VTSDPDDEAIDDLYRGPHEAFVEARNALADRLHGAAAERVRALRKPSVSAWAVNQLWWFERDAYDALHAAGSELLELQRSGASIAGQPANEARRAALDRLRRLAAQRLRAAGHAASTVTLRKISQSLEASAAGGSFGAHDPLGRLHTELTPPSFGEIARFAPPDGTASKARVDTARRAATELERARAARALADAASVLQAAEKSAADAEATLRRAQRTFEDANLTLERARARHRAAAAEDASVRARFEALEREEP